MKLGNLILYHRMDDRVESHVGQLYSGAAVMFFHQFNSIKLIKRQLLLGVRCKLWIVFMHGLVDW